MASRMMHLAITNELMRSYRFKDSDRLKFGAILPDACAEGASSADSHFKIGVCGNSKKTYDFTRYKSLFTEQMADEYIRKAVSFCLEELSALERGEAGMDEYRYAWKNTPST